MKNFLILTVALIVCLPLYLSANLGKILVENPNGTSSLHITFAAAVSAAQSGASLYLPAGYWEENVTISKRLNIYGVGHYPNSSPITPGTSRINSLTFLNNTDSTTIQGLIISNGLSYGNGSSVAVRNHYYLRCNIGGSFNIAVSGTNAISNHVFKECIINSLTASNATLPNNIIFTNCFFSVVGNLRGSNIYFTNCIFGSNNYFQNGTSRNLLIENSIFMRTTADGFVYLESSIVNNCIFLSPTITWGSNAGEDNILNQNCAGTFESGVCTSFSYAGDYRLKAGSPGEDAGTDGTDIGVYGGSSPFKTGGLPVIPSIKTFSVSKNPVDGKIQVQATAVSQTE
ncbi:MAG: hypothetical protein M9949_12415 [Candidatus Kapabacteria bacterium]|nr:hypothetical protein [Candidatus Kapabacteria bacterium]